MLNSLVLPFVSFLLLLCTSCDNKIVKGTTPLEIFDAFWKIMDERYVYFPERNIDWDSVYHANYPKVKNFTKEEELVPILQEIVSALGDRHIGIRFNDYFDVAVKRDSTLPFYEMPINRYGFNVESLESHKQYIKICNGITALPNERHNGIVYVNIPTFGSLDINNSVLKVIQDINYANGLIIDVRNNEGGPLDQTLSTLSLFYEGTSLIFYRQYKINELHEGFSKKYPFYHQGVGLISSKIPIVLLTSPSTYSAGNLFAFCMSELDNCIVLGQSTGGGGSGTQCVYLPNGGTFVYPSHRSYSAREVNQEFGLIPDVLVPLNKSDTCDYQVLQALEVLISLKENKHKIKDKYSFNFPN